MVKHEINEMEVCSDCYLNSILKFEDNWYCEPCVSLLKVQLKIHHLFFNFYQEGATPTYLGKNERYIRIFSCIKYNRFLFLPGFPFWPAKALRIVNGEIDVRFFGAHDRSWIEASKCFWLSRNTPNSSRQRLNSNIEPSLVELNLHIDRLSQRFGEFVYAPYKESVDPEKPFNFLPSIKCILSFSFIFWMKK